jgi:hypothetical protein
MAPCVLIRDLYSGIIILDASLYFRNLHRKLHHLIPIYPPIVKKFVDLYDPKNMTSALEASGSRKYLFCYVHTFGWFSTYILFENAKS